MLRGVLLWFGLNATKWRRRLRIIITVMNKGAYPEDEIEEEKEIFNAFGAAFYSHGVEMRCVLVVLRGDAG